MHFTVKLYITIKRQNSYSHSYVFDYNTLLRHLFERLKNINFKNKPYRTYKRILLYVIFKANLWKLCDSFMVPDSYK